MPDQPIIPTGAKLDMLVLWAVGYYNKESGYNGGADIITVIAARQGFDSQHQTGAQDERNIQRAIERVQKTGLITFDTGSGYRLAEVPR